jgi:F-type H+-transporting ATPase subunit gamma
MATLREIRQRIASVKSTQQITRAMKLVAAAKLRKSQQQLLRTRPYSDELNRAISILMRRGLITDRPLFKERENHHVCYVLITADRGLCGSFNANLIRSAGLELDKFLPIKPCLVTIGRKGYDYFRRREYPIAANYTDFFNRLNISQAEEIASQLIDRYLNGDIDRVYVIYNEYKTIVQQKIVVKQFLPIVMEPFEEPEIGGILFQPQPKKILKRLLPTSINYTLYRMLLESVTAEYGARMTAMELASDNAEEMIHDLILFYNKARQAAITKELSEIVGGAEALRG